jgi:hypothetical protein
MKRILSTLVFFALTFTSIADTLRLSEPAAQDAQTETFGIKIDRSLPKLTMANLVTDSSSHLASVHPETLSH